MGKKLAVVALEDVVEFGTSAQDRADREMTRKERKAAKEAEKRVKILEEADKIGQARNSEEKLVKARAEGIKLEDSIPKLEATQERIQGLLGEHDGEDDEEEFVKAFMSGFLDHEYECPISNCKFRGAAWILPLAISVAKTLDKRADGRDCPKRHSDQWEAAVEMFQNPEDLEGLVFCDAHQKAVEKSLEQKYPQEDPRNHVLYKLGGFVYQLGKNRHRLLREDLAGIEQEISFKKKETKVIEDRIALLELEVEEEKKVAEEINDLI